MPPPQRCPTLQKFAFSVMEPSASFRHEMLSWENYYSLKVAPKGVNSREHKRTDRMPVVLWYASTSWALCAHFFLFGRSRPSSPDRLCQVHPSVGVRSSSPLCPERVRTSIYRASVTRPIPSSTSGPFHSTVGRRSGAHSIGSASL
jgi:hypothetical protein